MTMNSILIATLMITGLGFLISLLLAIAAKVFAVQINPRVEAIATLLPGVNCGGCGYASCADVARMVAEGNAGADICVVGGFTVVQSVAKIMGLSADRKLPVVETPDCRYGQEKVARYRYAGIADCRAAVNLYGGFYACSVGCLGLGTCARVCPSDAIKMVGGLPVIDYTACTGCGVCTTICPKHVITMFAGNAPPDKNESAKVAECRRRCQAKETVRFTVSMERCKKCGLCFKACPSGAIIWERKTVARIDQSKCTQCLACFAVCPFYHHD